MQSKTTISYLMLAVYALMLVHIFIPHHHGISLWQPASSAAIYTDGNICNYHRLHHQMPQHTHLQYCEYFTLPDYGIQAGITADDVSLPFVVPHIYKKPVEMPEPLILGTNRVSSLYILPIHCGFFTSVKLLRAPPTA